MRLRETQTFSGARLEGWAAPWFETPRTRLRNGLGAKIAAPHQEAERGRVGIKLPGIRLGQSRAGARRHIGDARGHAELLAAHVGEQRDAVADLLDRGAGEAEPHPALAIRRIR